MKMYKLLLIFVCYAFSNDFNIESGSYFPLVNGSYWVYRDSVYNPADEEFIGTSSLHKDSIINVTLTDTGTIADITNLLIDKGKISFKGNSQYLQKGNIIYWHAKEKGLKWGAWETYCKVSPTENDTIIKESFKRVYKKINSSEIQIFSLINIDPKSKKLFGTDIDYFCKDIGLIGNAGDEFSTNLIEYRIGNGPVIKKHWLMKKPEK